MNSATLAQPSDSIQIHPIQLAEIPLLLAVLQAAFAEYDRCLTPPSGVHTESIESLTAKLARGGGAFAWHGDRAVGSVLFEPRAEALYLGRMAVLPAYRRQGIGARLVAYVEEQALARGLKQITLGVRLQLPENTAFYTRLGYHIVSYGSHVGFTEPTYMNMAKQLDKRSHTLRLAQPDCVQPSLD
jgi:GNAT superfamily N-acetyltransferase